MPGVLNVLMTTSGWLIYLKLPKLFWCAANIHQFNLTAPAGLYMPENKMFQSSTVSKATSYRSC
jgi:hypothetical protein